MARILSVASTEILITSRQLLLEQQGFSVCSALNLADLELLDKTETVDLALIGHGLRGSEKRKIAHAIRRYYPGLPILEMCLHSPEIPDADFVFTASPDELIAAIRHVLAGRRVRGFIE